MAPRILGILESLQKNRLRGSCRQQATGNRQQGRGFKEKGTKNDFIFTIATRSNHYSVLAVAIAVAAAAPTGGAAATTHAERSRLPS
ncbi:MAG: hypothetical protein SXA11_08410 [Cyanobacteriota bacterium]|nr:hypothetical protein [Cyanobacteriota bacterium]